MRVLDHVAAQDDADVIVDAARELMGPRHDGQFYHECPGCDGWVHHTELTEHARSCAPLRALVIPTPETPAHDR